MAVETERRAKKTASRLDKALLLQPIKSAMSLNSMNQTPPVHGSTGDTTRTRSPSDCLEFKSSLSDKEPASQPHQHSTKKRRSSKTKTSGELRRSSSTPHMRNLAVGSSGELSPTSNKARNKLGYHRSSVACGHCRRRKIRCLLAPDDPQGRCANCIRLKKDCNFYPVEHNGEVQLPQTLGTRDTSTGPPVTPATSPPRLLQSVSGEMVGEFRAPFPGTQPVVHNTAFGFQSDSEVDVHQIPLQSRIHVPSQGYSYPPPIETQWPPTSSFLPSSTIAESPSSSTGHWRQSPSTANSAYGSESNVSGGHTPAAMSTSSTMSYGHQEGHAWSQQPPFQAPTRSMSYGIIEGLPQQYPGQGLGIIPHDYSRRNSPYPYAVSIDTNSSVMHASTLAGSAAGPLSAPIVPNNQFYPSAWSPYEAMPTQGLAMQLPGRSMSAQWYREPGQLGRVQEEGVPPMAYNQHGMPQYYSGA